ncbi:MULTISPECIES: excisionase [Castellaniella]|uniref:excisionase n=1 Tax=Castellaniella TaxID=359336 RepID=UPI0039C2905A
MTIRYITIIQFAKLSGYTENAIRTKLRDGVWREGHEWVKAPDGRILIDTEGYDAWVGTEGVLPPPRKAVFKSRSSTGAAAAGKRFGSSPRPLI